MDGAKSLAQFNDHVEDYDPTIEWVRDTGFDTLLLFIPGDNYILSFPLMFLAF